MCKSARVSIVPAIKQEEESAFLGVVTDNGEQNGWQRDFCIDIGAEVTVIPEEMYFDIGRPALKALDDTIKGAGNNRLDCRD